LDIMETLGGMESWEWAVDAGRVTWSDNLLRIFGLEPDDAAPRRSRPVGYRDVRGTPAKTYSQVHRLDKEGDLP
jgi:hypothetical protein